MYISSLRLHQIGPFDDVEFSFCNESGDIRPATLIFGENGTGKTAILAAIATTRPALCVMPPKTRMGYALGDAFAVAKYRLGQDDPDRPVDLVIASPNAALDETPAEHTVRKREQTHFDRLATERGFCLVSISAMRWMSRLAPGMLPMLFGTDQRAVSVFDDASRADFAREIKSTLVSAITESAISSFQQKYRDGKSNRNYSLLDVLKTVLEAMQLHEEVAFEGLDTHSLEPLFRSATGHVMTLDDLPMGCKNRLILALVTLRRLIQAYPYRNPLDCEAIALVDEIEAHVPFLRQRSMLRCLQRAFPKVQWIATTQSYAVAEACEPHELIVLSRDIFDGEMHASVGLNAFFH